MPITGTIIMMGGLPPDGLPYRKEGAPAGLLIQVSPDAAGLVDTMRGTVEVWPACADDLAPGECTPENYAHLKQRLSAAADNLAREVRSNQAAALVRADLETEAVLHRAANSSLRNEVNRLAAELAAALSEIGRLRTQADAASISPWMPD